jgi:ATP-dependent RNA helicase DOB1
MRIKGVSDPLSSTFHLGYSMLLNLMRVEGADPEHVIKRSFYQFQHDRALPQFSRQIEETQTAIAQLGIEGPASEEIGALFEMQDGLAALQREIQRACTLPAHCLPFLQPGRVVHVKHSGADFGTGIIMNFTRNEAQERAAAAAGGSAASAYTVDLLVRCVADCHPPKPLADPSTASWHASDGAEIVTLPLVAIAAFTQARLKVLKDLRSLDQRRRMMDLLAECCRRCEGGQPPLLDPVASMGIKDEGFKKLLRQAEDIEFRIKKHALSGRADCQDLMNKYVRHFPHCVFVTCWAHTFPHCVFVTCWAGTARGWSWRTRLKI